MLRSISRRPARTLRLLVKVLIVSSVACPAWATQTPLLSAKDLDEKAQVAVAERIGVMLDERYVFPEVAKKCAAHLLELSKSGALSDATDPEALAEKLTKALRSVSADKHLLVRVRAKAEEAEPTATPHPLKDNVRRFLRDRRQNFGFEKLERLEGNVGYLDLRSFMSPGVAFDTAVAAMAFLANSDAIIVDLRQNSGGHPGMVTFLCSHFFNEPTHLNSLYFREGDRTDDFWTHGVPGTAMPDVPLFVLTGAKTFSAAEEFSYNLRTQRRATLVGETTRGGANPGGLFSIDDQFEMVIPTGRAINPITGTNWEGTGVIPHVPTTASRAYKTALELASAAAESHRSRTKARWAHVEELHAEALRLDGEGNIEAATAAMSQALEGGLSFVFFDERDIHSIAQHLLDENRRALALVAFHFNVSAFPESTKAKDELKRAQATKADGK